MPSGKRTGRREAGGTGSRRTRKRRTAKGGGAAAKGRRWSHKVKTVSTFPPEGTFTKDADTVARVLASKRVSPKGIGSGIRMIQFFINRAGRRLPARQRRELEKAKRILQERHAKEQGRARTAAPRRRAA